MAKKAKAKKRGGARAGAGRPTHSKGPGLDRTFYLRDDQHAKIKDAAKKSGISMSQLVGEFADGL